MTMAVAEPALSALARPRLGRRFVLRPGDTPASRLLDDGQQTITLNETAAEILSRCDGHHSVGGLVDELRAMYVAADRVRIACAVHSFLELALSKAWITLDSHPDA